jgi:hypothetical protein
MVRKLVVVFVVMLTPMQQRRVEHVSIPNVERDGGRRRVVVVSPQLESQVAGHVPVDVDVGGVLAARTSNRQTVVVVVVVVVVLLDISLPHADTSIIKPLAQFPTLDNGRSQRELCRRWFR